MRKIIILTIILLLSISFISAKSTSTSKRITLEKDQSTEFNGKRITLLNLDFENERVLVCINGKKMILSDKTKKINDAILDLRKVTMNKAEIRIWVDCPDCECDETCDNSVCFDECYKDKNCDDGNDLTEDKCYGDPRRCHYKKVKECTIDEHCDDMDECTIDKCSEILEKCVHTEKTGCKKEKTDKITSATTFKKTRYAQTIHPLLLSIAFGVMIIAIVIKKFKY